MKRDTPHNSSVRRWTFRLLLICGSLLFGFLFLEALLRVAPGVFGQTVQNLAFMRYGLLPGDIYYLEPVSRIYFMHPNYETDAFYNGYRWLHRTDQLGFRNPPGIAGKEILLFGDSLIYGHGVNEEQIVSHFLRTKYGVGAYNMARQGDCLYQNYVLLRLYLQEFKPRKVIFFTFLNDFHDLESYRTTRQIEDPPELQEYDYEAIRVNVRQLSNQHRSTFSNVAFRMPSVRLLWRAGELLKTWKFNANATREAEAAGEPDIPAGTRSESILDPVRSERVFRYYNAILNDVRARCKANGADLILVYLYIRSPAGSADSEAQEKFQDAMRTYARSRRIRFWSSQSVFEMCRKCFLKGDGHLSEFGHEKLADAFYKQVLQSSAPRSRPSDGGALQSAGL